MKNFFEKHIKIIATTKAVCSECGASLLGDYGEVAHILPKSKFKSIAEEDDNIIYLCGQFSQNQCHTKYDYSPLEKIKQMKIYPTVIERFKKLEPKITEKINIITRARYGEDY